MAIPRGAGFHEPHADKWGDYCLRYGFRRRIALFTTIIDRSVTPGQRWLDLGCGSGVLSSRLLARGAGVVALDGSPAMLAAARRTLDPLDSSVVYKHGDALDLSWSEPHAFDGVLCSSVIEYVEDPDELIRQIRRVLKDRGLLIISVPPTRSFVRTLQKAARYLLRVSGRLGFTYLEASRLEVDPAAIAGWFGSAGLRLVRVSAFDPILPDWLLTLVRPALLICEACASEHHTRPDDR